MDPKEVRRESMPNMPSAQLESLSLVEEPGAASPIGYPPPPRERHQGALPTHEGHSLNSEGMAWGHSLDSEGVAWAPPPRADEAVCGASPPGVRVVPRPSTKEGRRGSSLVLPSDAPPPTLPSTREPGEAEASDSPSTSRSAPPPRRVSSSLSSVAPQPTAAAEEASGATCASPAPLPGASSPLAGAAPPPSFTPSRVTPRTSLDARLATHSRSPTASFAAAPFAAAAAAAATTPAAFHGQHRQQRAPPPAGAASAETGGEAGRARHGAKP